MWSAIVSCTGATAGGTLAFAIFTPTAAAEATSTATNLNAIFPIFIIELKSHSDHRRTHDRLAGEEDAMRPLLLSAVGLLLASIAMSCGSTNPVLTPSPSDRQRIAALLERYYKFGAATGDGDEACGMLAASLRQAVVRHYGKGSDGPSYLRAGTTCQGVAKLLFTHFERRIEAEWDHVEIVGLRTHDNHVVAIVRFGKTPERQIAVRREGGAWKMDSLLDEKLS